MAREKHPSKTFKIQSPESVDYRIMEAFTQLCARQKYTKILEYYNYDMSKSYVDKIWREGVGYTDECNKLRHVLDDLSYSSLITIAKELASGEKYVRKCLLSKGWSVNHINAFIANL